MEPHPSIAAVRKAAAQEGEARSAGRMKVVINGRFLSQKATGVQRVASELTRAIDQLLIEPPYANLEVRLAVPSDGQAGSLDLRRIALDRLEGAGSHFWEQVTLPRRLGDATLLCLGNTAPIIALLRRSQTGVMLHDQAFLLYPQDYSLAYRAFHTLLGRVILNRARPLFTVSKAERAAIVARNRKMKAPIVVAPNGSWFGDAPCVAEPAHPCEPQYGLYVGSFTTRKNVELAFNLALELAAERGLRFVFVGPPNKVSQAFEQRIPPVLAPLIELRGYVPNDALPELYGRAAFLLYPTFYEASGLPPSEAMTFGCPVITSDIPVMRERCGEAALYGDPHAPASFKAAALRLISDPALRLQLTAYGLAQASSFTWQRQAAQVLDALTVHAP